jgi:ABC-type multidrug transport system ATPase subunit
VTTTPVLVLDSIVKSFGRRRVLSAATVHVHAGRITALLGRNGCGKTTLLRIAVGEEKRDSGLIRFLDVPLHRPRLHRMAPSGFFYLPERGLLAGEATVGERMRALARRYGLADGPAIIERLRLAELLARAPAQLSTGERRRAEIALALLRRPRCLIADEPFLGIAPHDADVIAVALRALAVEGCALLVTGHEVRLLLDLADDIVWMAGGTTHALGAPADAARNGSFMRDYLGGMPAVR